MAGPSILPSPSPERGEHRQDPNYARPDARQISSEHNSVSSSWGAGRQRGSGLGYYLTREWQNWNQNHNHNVFMNSTSAHYLLRVASFHFSSSFITQYFKSPRLALAQGFLASQPPPSLIRIITGPGLQLTPYTQPQETRTYRHTRTRHLLSLMFAVLGRGCQYCVQNVPRARQRWPNVANLSAVS